MKLTANFEREVLAFLNCRNGGEIFLGIADDGNVVRHKDFDNAQLQIKDRLK